MKVGPEMELGGLGVGLGGRGSPPKSWVVKELPGISERLLSLTISHPLLAYTPRGTRNDGRATIRGMGSTGAR
jgi:hypothetical protein